MSKSGYEAEIILGSSGKLTAQIQQGAPFDVFVSADMKYPQALYLSGYSTQPPRVYAIGNLVIWSMFENLTLHLDSLSKPEIKHIAIANPKTAPYGMAALEFIEKQGYMDVFMPKLVYGENIAQTNQFIISKTAEAGFTAKSVVMASSMRNRGKWINVPDSLYTPIQQGAVIIQRKEGISESAKAFYNFLYSAGAKAILESYGYTILHEQ
jgi:molybdate transport system substrate-binding protein